MSNEPEIDVQRRRKADKPTERAEAPSRPPSSSTGGTGGGGGGSYRPSLGGGINIPTKGKLGGCGGVIVIIVIILYILLGGGGGSDGDTSAPLYEQPTESSPTGGKRTYQHATPNPGTRRRSGRSKMVGHAVRRCR